MSPTVRQYTKSNFHAPRSKTYAIVEVKGRTNIIPVFICRLNTDPNLSPCSGFQTSIKQALIKKTTCILIVLDAHSKFKEKKTGCQRLYV